MTPTTPDPLDVSTLRAHRGRRRSDNQGLLDRIAAHLDHHDGYVAWSGGKDSTAVVSLARQVDPNVPIAFYHCGLEYPENLDYIHSLTKTWGLQLHVLRTEPDLLTALVAAGGFTHEAPSRSLGFSMHEAMMREPINTAHANFGAGSLWGVRSAESSGRRNLYRTHLHREIHASRHGCCHTPQQQRQAHGGVIARNDHTVTYGPIWDWTTNQVHEYLDANQIPANPLYAKLRRLGADDHSARVDVVLDPDHLSHGQVARLKHGWPQLYTRLRAALPRLDEFS